MPLFQVLTPPHSADPLDNVYLEERFSWFAALLPPIWALSHAMWLEALVWLVKIVGIYVASLFIGGDAAFWLYVVFAIWIGFSASDIRAFALNRRAYASRGTLAASDLAMAERDFLSRTAPL